MCVDKSRDYTENSSCLQISILHTNVVFPCLLSSFVRPHPYPVSDLYYGNAPTSTLYYSRDGKGDRIRNFRVFSEGGEDGRTKHACGRGSGGVPPRKILKIDALR